MIKQKFLIPILSGSVSYAVAILLALAIDRWSWPGLYIYIIGFIGILAATISAIIVEKKHEEEVEQTSSKVKFESDDAHEKYVQENRIVCETIINTELERVAQTLLSENKAIRSNVFLLDVSDNKLYIAFNYGMENSPDLNIRLLPGKGCAGDAWEFAEISVADLSSSVDYELRYKWKLSRDQISTTRHLKAILAVPIRHPKENKRIIGVLNLDSSEPIFDQFTRADIQERAEQFAFLIGVMLWLGNIVQRE